MSLNPKHAALVEEISTTIIRGFNRHFRIFNEYTAKASVLFEKADWRGIQEISKQRMMGYDLRVAETIEELSHLIGEKQELLDEGLWRDIRSAYAERLMSHLQPKLAESYYNSVFCRLHHRRYYNNDNIFVTSALSSNDIRVSSPVVRSYRCKVGNILDTFEQVIVDFNFSLPFENIKRDIRCVLKRYLKISRFDVKRNTTFRLDVVKRPFFRSKAAYIIGRIATDYGDQPFSIPILNNEQGGLYLDTLMLDNEDLNVLFGFARAYFLVETDSPAALVSFLQRLLLRKSRTELYTHMGFQKHGKTQFYREFLAHLHDSTDNLVIAPGIEGMVMAVFTLPSFPYVFKIIKDKFPPEKHTTEEEIKQKYMLVKYHDRVGRMADTLEYSHVALPRERFSDELLLYLQKVAPSKINTDGDQVVIKHLYIERRMTPLNIFLQTATPPQMHRAIQDFGEAIKHMMAVNIFPGDMLLKNFGVSRHGRVVFYDYDEIEYMTTMNFRKLPESHNDEEEFSDRPWFHVAMNDVFPEQFLRFVLVRPEYREPFLAHHAELLDPAYWQEIQSKIEQGVYLNVFPYAEETRFCHQYDGEE